MCDPKRRVAVFAPKNTINDDHIPDDIKLKRWRMYTSTTQGQMQVLIELGGVA